MIIYDYCQSCGGSGMGCPDCDSGLVEVVRRVEPKSAYDVAREMFGNESSSNATKAAKKMKEYHWIFVGYDDNGEPTYIPPGG